MTPTPKRHHGFTLIELLVAIGILAMMAGLSWRGLDGMSKAQAQLQQRADTVLTLQAGLSQWAADLDALLQLPNTPALDWDGRALRITRRSTAAPGDGLLVVAWSRRDINGTGQWLRWQSLPLRGIGAWTQAWEQAAAWAQNASEESKTRETVVLPLTDWQIFYFRGNAWTNPLSSAGTTQVGADVASSTAAAASAPTVVVAATTVTTAVTPDGVRLVLNLAGGQAISGTLTRDWVRPVLGGGK